MKHNIKIVKEGKIRTFFVKANGFLIEKYAAKNDLQLNNAWFSEYGAVISKDEICFDVQMASR